MTLFHVTKIHVCSKRAVGRSFAKWAPRARVQPNWGRKVRRPIAVRLSSRRLKARNTLAARDERDSEGEEEGEVALLLLLLLLLLLKEAAPEAAEAS